MAYNHKHYDNTNGSFTLGQHLLTSSMDRMLFTFASRALLLKKVVHEISVVKDVRSRKVYTRILPSLLNAIPEQLFRRVCKQ